MRTSDMKPLTVYKTHGRVISRVFDCDNGWKEYKSRTQAPPEKYRLSYDLKFNKRTVLLLDDYGNEAMPSEVELRLMGKDFISEWLLGIDRETGELLRFVFYRVREETIACFTRFASNPKVPQKFLTEKNLRYIWSCKRPWEMTWRHDDWLALWGRDMTWDDFIATGVIRLELFPPKSVMGQKRFLEVWGDSHRIITEWSRPR